MEHEQKFSRIAIVLGLIILGSLSRLIPHWPNFTALGAIALFGGASFKPKYLSCLITLGVLFITDYLFFGFYPSMWTTYLAFLMISTFGTLIKKDSVTSVFTHSLGASLLFFLVTNFASWLSIPSYPKNVYGLLLAYAQGLPFALNFTLGTLFFSSILFGMYKLSTKRLQLAA